MATLLKPTVSPLAMPSAPSGSISSLPVRTSPAVCDTDACAVVCQICLEVTGDVPSRTSICGPACPAVVCAACFETHVRVSLESTPPGILPRLRCPVCLVRIPKIVWRDHVDESLVERYESLCEKACAFVAPCCHNDDYTQQLEWEDSTCQLFESFMEAQLHEQIPLLQDKLTRFTKYEIPARELVQCIDMIVAPLGFTPLAHQEFLDQVALRIHDDERRAALVIAFHTIHRRVITRCCFLPLCFVCKRKWANDHDENPTGPCEQQGLIDSDLAECRACRVTLVKVEGCDAVQCPCGFQMKWKDELRFQREHRQGLLPAFVDMYDLEGFQRWQAWRNLIQIIFRYDVPRVLENWRRRQVDRGIAQCRSLLRGMLQTFIWRRRFRILLPGLVQHIHNTRRGFLVQRLRRCGFFRKPVRDRALTRVWFRRCMQQIRRHVAMFDEEVLVSGEADLAFGLFGEW